MNLPVFVIYARGTVPARSTHLGMVMELALLAVAQYANYNFDAMTKFGDVYLGCNELGIFTLDGSTDDNIDIDSFFELLTTDFGIPNQKRIRKIYLGYETSGSLILEIKDDENNVRRYTLAASLDDQRQHGARVAVGRDGKGRYWSFRLENVDGCDFSVDSLDALVTVLARKPGKTRLNAGRLLLPSLAMYRSEGS